MTNTNYKPVSFECKKRNAKGETFSLRISLWNVDGLCSWLKKGDWSFWRKKIPIFWAYNKPNVQTIKYQKKDIIRTGVIIKKRVMQTLLS